MRYVDDDSLQRQGRLAASAYRLESLRDGLALRLNDCVATKAPILGEAVGYFMTRRGKLFRPILTLLACEAAGGDANASIDFACAVELVHCSSLIFDDLPCMDNSCLRRGQPALHTRFGEAIAILVGVHLLTKAFEAAAKTDQRAGGGATAILCAAITPMGMVEGQVLDLAGRLDDDMVRELKTMSLIRAAVQLGAYAARANEAHQQALQRYGVRIGMAMQLRDDILDGDTTAHSQQRAEQVATAAAEDILATFGNSEAAVSLAELANHVVSRNE